MVIIDAIANKAASVSLSVHGTRAMQTLVEALATNIKGMEGHCRQMIAELNKDIL